VRGASALQELLTELAIALLPRGMTPKQFADLARLAFVRAAQEMSRLRNGKINQSRVAAQTGLSRADVKRLLESEKFDAYRSDQSPVERVINGWRTDRQFTYRRGRPKRLPISGSGGSFTHLARKYGGDVPHRAVLDELRRIGAIKDHGSSVSLKASPILQHRHDFAFLSPVLPVLVDGIRIARRGGKRSVASCIHRLRLPVDSEIDLALVRERIAMSAKSMLNGLGESLGTAITVPRRRGNSAYTFTITVLLVEDRTAKNQHSRGATDSKAMM
jgi:hypothetical protein